MSDADEKISRLYHETREQEPSPKLDDAILRASREASEKPVRTGPFSATWPAAASFAAVIVIATILAPVLKQEELEQQTAQDLIDKSISYEVVGDGLFDSYSASENAGSLLIPLSDFNEDSPRSERGMLAEEPAVFDSGIASPDARRAQPLQKLPSSAAKLEQPAAESPAGNITSRMRAADSAPFAVLTPEMWEVKIERLIEDGDYENARAEFDLMKQHFPDYTISQSLLDKLGP